MMEVCFEELRLMLPVIVADVGQVQAIIGMEFLRHNNCVLALREGVMKCASLCCK